MYFEKGIAMIVLIIIGTIFLSFIAVILTRALLFKPDLLQRAEGEEVCFDSEGAVYSLSEMIKCKTVSDSNKACEDEREFVKFKMLLRTLFPRTYEVSTVEEPSDRAILIKWEGKNHSSPTVLMAHYDVVSANEEAWDIPAFDGCIKDGMLWGRGAIDTKVTLNAIMYATETLIKEGFTPENDIYMAFGGDEEINGHGAKDIVALFSERGITPGIVLDEGGAVVEGVFPGMKNPAALVGIAEKGMLNVEYSVRGGGGHSSAPERITPVGRLSRACVRIENKPFKFTLTPPAVKLFDNLARHSTFVYRLIFANLWCFSPILNIITSKSGGELNAIVRTTTAFTQMEGSRGMNVIPPYARMVSNHRIIPGESAEGVLERIKKTVNDPKVDVGIIGGINPSRVSVTDGEPWHRLVSSISGTWNTAIVSPYLMLACSDSRHWDELSDRVYRFSPMSLSKEERATIHGNNERIPITTIAKTVEFYIRFIKNS